MGTVYLNGRFIAQEQATVSVLDRGFLLGDGIYEVIPVYHGKPFRLTQHLQRMHHSLGAILLSSPLSYHQWQEVIEELILRNGGGDQSLYLQITRGPAPRDQAFPENVTPTVLAMSNPVDPATEHLDAVSAICVKDIRWERCDIKSISLLANVLAKQQAAIQGKSEALLIRDGLLTEGAASNIFIVKNGVLCTPAKSPYLLPGITRDLILELAEQHGIPSQEREIRQEELYHADEVWLTSSSREILPVVALDDHPIANGQPGPVWRQMLTYYRQYKANLAKEA